MQACFRAWTQCEDFLWRTTAGRVFNSQLSFLSIICLSGRQLGYSLVLFVQLQRLSSLVILFSVSISPMLLFLFASALFSRAVQASAFPLLSVSQLST